MNEAQFFAPWRVVAEFADDSRLTFDGFTEEQARAAMEAAQNEHGDIAWWDHVTDVNYSDGQYYKTLRQPPTVHVVDFSGYDGPLLKSYLAALKADMTPTCIDGQTGYFSSRHGNYVVTLDVPNGCVCGSHTRPCKHQYRLAMELNLMPGDFIHDPSKIKYKLDGVDFETAVDRIEQLPATAQKELFGILSSLFNGKVYSGTLSEDSARALVGGNVLLWIDDPAGYRLCTDLDKSSFMLDKYLRRKFDFDIYFDPYNRGTFSVPHGCTAVYDEDDPGHPYTVTAPDRTEQDKKINAMLQKHHCDPLDGFTVRFGE